MAIHLNKIKVHYDKRPWVKCDAGTFYVSKEEFIFSELQKNNVWNNVSGGKYDNYKCFDENCNTKLRVKQLDNPVRAQVEIKGEHIKEHNKELQDYFENN